MLELRDITKQYPAGDKPVEALRGVSLKFRQSEFVSILGPSGCGKTTLLNIVGGLDQYTSGDLIINGKSTKDFNDRDWDTYRNHSIGFVFQSYNLIPHQSVLQNVEIALTVSGVSKKERRKRAIEALEKVGLGDQLKKRPNQISGGQMQRVAIARALVNDPDIILADEPTGALDTETGVQVMELLKDIAKDRLVIMVTHNSHLAQEYSTRIINMLDGKITNDTRPLDKSQRKEDKQEGKKPSMSIFTAFMLSLKNLFTKKGRTLLTAFAGSIGIMGIALVLAVSQGTSKYIDSVQEDALSSYPLSIERTSIDITTLMQTFMSVGKQEINHEKDAVYKKAAIYEMVNALNNLEARENDLKSFKQYLEKEQKENEVLGKAITGLQYSYDLELNVFTKGVDGQILESNTSKLLRELMAEHMSLNISQSGETSSQNSPFASMSFMGMGMMSRGLWNEIIPGKDGQLVNDVVMKQYDIVYGNWPKAYDEIILVLDKNNELDDITLYALGLETKENIDALMQAALKGGEVPKNESRWTYEEIVKSEYRVILSSDSYSYDDRTDLYLDLRKTDAGLKYLYDNALVLKVTGIVRPNKNAQSTVLNGAIAYTEALTKHVVEKSENTKIIIAQKESVNYDVLTGLPFKSTTGNLSALEKKEKLYDYLINLDQEKKAMAYISIMSIAKSEDVEAVVEAALLNNTREQMDEALLEALVASMSLDIETANKYIASLTDEEITDLFSRSIAEKYKAQYKQEVRGQLAQMEAGQLAYMLEQALDEYTQEEYEIYYDEIMVFSDSTYEENLVKMGFVDLESPEVINIFASSFANKDYIEKTIKEYNKDKADLEQIKYTDYLKIIMSSITTILNAITYVLLAFVAISLIVSSIMIGVITLISVQERTKEIGILRAIGASKGDVSSMFNAETAIIGFTSGLIGVGVTYMLCIPINFVLHKLTKISNLSALLPLNAAIILVLISIGLSLIAGLIPSRSAAKKDPVVALRTE